MNRIKLAALSVATAGVLAALVTVPVAPASAAKPKPTPSPTSTTPVEYTETGCYDVTNGGPHYQKLLQSITTVTAPTAGVGGTYKDLVLSEEGLLETQLGLAAPSCLDATYELEAFDKDGNSLGKVRAPGNGTESVRLDLMVRDQDSLVVYAQARIIAPTGQVVYRGGVDEQTGAERSLAVTADADGTPVDDTGGNVTWR